MRTIAMDYQTFDRFTYRTLRRRGFTTQTALARARMARRIDWDYEHPRVGFLDFPDERFIGVIAADWDDMDWGDMDPTDEERERCQCVWVQVTVYLRDRFDSPDLSEDIGMAAIGGMCWADLDGWLTRSEDEAIVDALVDYLDPELRRQIADYVECEERESRERLYWAARDVLTVGGAV